jgi:hypothetical protein
MRVHHIEWFRPKKRKRSAKKNAHGPPLPPAGRCRAKRGVSPVDAVPTPPYPGSSPCQRCLVAAPGRCSPPDQVDAHDGRQPGKARPWGGVMPRDRGGTRQERNPRIQRLGRRCRIPGTLPDSRHGFPAPGTAERSTGHARRRWRTARGLHLRGLMRTTSTGGKGNEPAIGPKPRATWSDDLAGCAGGGRKTVLRKRKTWPPLNCEVCQDAYPCDLCPVGQGVRREGREVQATALEAGPGDWVRGVHLVRVRGDRRVSR